MNKDILSQFTTSELEAIQKGDLSSISTEKLELLQKMKQQSTDTQQAVPTQKLRSFAQGMTFGGADEAEAFLRSMAGENYDEALKDIRTKLKAYRGDRPWEAIGFEAGGATIPAIATAIYTGGASAPATLFPQLARLAKVGAVESGLTGFLSSEGDIVDRTAAVPGAAASGAVLAPAVGVTVKAGGKSIESVIDYARRKLGDRGAKVAETELQRIADATGLTTSEIVARIANGEIMAENRTIQDIVRGYARAGDVASTTIRSALENRPDYLQRIAVDGMQKSLAKGPGNVLKRAVQDDAAAKKLENRLYQGAFNQGGVMNADMMKSLSDALKRSPDSINNINTLYRAQTGKNPFFRFKDGDIEFDRAPTLEDAEIIRRGIQASIDEAFRTGRGAVGSALKPVEEGLRDALNASSPALQTARSTASNIRATRDAFQAGRQAFGQSADQIQIDFEKLIATNNQSVIQAYRSGVMDAIRNKMSSGNKTTTIKNLADPENKMGQILRTVYPGDDLDKVLAQLNLATQSRQAANAILGGSSTAPTMMAAQQQGSRMAVGDLVGASRLDPMSIMRLGKNVVDQLAPRLSEADRGRIANILVSEDPEVVRRALTDNSALAELQRRVQMLTNRGATTAGSMASILSGPASGLLSTQLFTGGR